MRRNKNRNVIKQTSDYSILLFFLVFILSFEPEWSRFYCLMALNIIHSLTIVNKCIFQVALKVNRMGHNSQEMHEEILFNIIVSLQESTTSTSKATKYIFREKQTIINLFDCSQWGYK